MHKTVDSTSELLSSELYQIFNRPLGFENVPQQVLYLHKRQIQPQKSVDSASELVNISIAHQALKLYKKYFICTKGKSICTNQLTQQVSFISFQQHILLWNCTTIDTLFAQKGKFNWIKSGYSTNELFQHFKGLSSLEIVPKQLLFCTKGKFNWTYQLTQQVSFTKTF